MKEKISKLVNVYKKYGLVGFCKKLYAYIVANYLDKIIFKVFICMRKYTKHIENILENNDYERIIYGEAVLDTTCHFFRDHNIMQII